MSYFSFPSECVYGALGTLASELDAPMGFAYPALLTAAGLCVRPTNSVLASLFTVLLGPTSSGKGFTSKRAIESLEVDPERVIKTTPNSDRGLATILHGESRKREVLLFWDEMVKVLLKAGIEGSSLASDLNTLFIEDNCGGADKKGKAIVENSRISILGNLPIENPEDFSLYFGSTTLTGLADRFVFAAPEKPFVYRPFEKPKTIIRFEDCRMPGEFFTKMHEWVAKCPQTRGKRLGEILLRVALITASANGDKEVNERSFWAAQKFMEWQEEIRKVYRPGEAKNHSAEVTAIILGALEKLRSGMTGVEERGGKLWISPSRLYGNNRLYEKYGAPSCRSCLDALIATRGVSHLADKNRSILVGPQSHGVFGSEAAKI